MGIGGLALGGGHGLAGRRFGLTSDNLLAARIVTADGRVRHADADTNEDLFWACRGGGGGNFGIVTALTLKTHRAPGGAWFSVSWPWSQAEEALAAWQRFAPEAPPALTSILSLGTTGGSGPPRVAAVGQYFGDLARLRRLVAPLTRVAGASLSSGSSSYLSLVLRWAGCLDGGLAACHRSTRSSFFAKSDYFDKRLGPRGRAIMIDWIERRQRNPSLGSGALLLDAYGGALNRPAADATAFVHRDMLFSLQYLAYFSGGAAGRASRRWINGVVARAATARVRRGLPELHRPAARALAAGVLRIQPRAPARDQEAGGPRLPLSLPPGDTARALMDRDSLRGLRAQPGYLKFLSAATLARVSDEMFSVGVVLLVLERTDSAGLAGATVAAITLPSLISGPLLGAWLDLTGPAQDTDGDRPTRDRDGARGARGARRPRAGAG